MGYMWANCAHGIPPGNLMLAIEITNEYIHVVAAVVLGILLDLKICMCMYVHVHFNVCKLLTVVNIWCDELEPILYQNIWWHDMTCSRQRFERHFSSSTTESLLRVGHKIVLDMCRANCNDTSRQVLWMIKWYGWSCQKGWKGYQNQIQK